MPGYAVIGAGYGDEGKGAMVDFLASRLLSAGRKPIVARCNGGAQAGHTVQTPDGQRHVFHHFGSGSLLDVPTFLSSDFIVNPIIFRMEREDLQKLGHNPKVFVDPEAIVTLPMDMMINQALETSRGNDRHGSCGVGIGETVQRSLTPSADVKVKHLKHLTEASLNMICVRYGKERLKQLGVTAPNCFDDLTIDRQFLEDVRYFLDHASIDPDLNKHGNCVIFEGAQGLGLDQDKGHFPYVTRSNTGFKNIGKLVDKFKVRDIRTIYVTRCYATRHGAGPLEHEGHQHLAYVEDPTNVDNQWQQSLRQAPLDIDLLCKRIREDFEWQRGRGIAIAMTCFDQINDRINAVYKGILKPWKPKELIYYIVWKTLGGEHFYTGHGPTRESYKEHKGFLDLD